MKLLAFFIVFVSIEIVQATPPSTFVRRSCYPSYVAPIQAHYVPQQIHYVPQQVEVQREYYWSIDNSYRDKIFLDAIVGRLTTMKDAEEIRRFRSKDVDPRFDPRTEHPKKAMPPITDEVPEGFSTEVPKGLKEAVDAKCIKCHNPSLPERADLSNLATTPPLVRWQAHGLVNAGEMPKGGGAVNDETVLAFYNWAKLGSKTVAKGRSR